MKLLLLSDSHRQTEYMHLAIQHLRPDAVLHLGDCVLDAEQLQYPGLPVLSVRGNCEAGFPERAEQLLREIDGVRIFAVHGHRYGVKQGYLRAELAAREVGAQVLAFGHTHRAFCEERDGLWIINPGACSGSAPSCGVVELKNGKATCYTMDIFLDLGERL